MIWRIKKYDWSREVTWRENKSSCFPPDVVFPCRVSRHNALQCITSCYSFRYNKQLIAQLVGKHEDLSHPEKFMSPSGFALGRHEFSGWDKSSCLPPNWAINVYCLLKVLLEWMQFWYDVVTLVVQNNIQKPERKICSESRDIDENAIVQWLGETFGIFRRLAAEWRRQAFVYDVIGNMAMATSADARGDSSHRKRWVLRRW